MRQVGAYEAKTRLSQLIDEAAKGEEIIITKHGVPVAALIPVAGSSQQDPQVTIADIKVFRRGRRLARLSIRQLVEDGRL